MMMERFGSGNIVTQQQNSKVNVRFAELQEQDLPAVKNIYDWYIANSTATFHTQPIAISELKEFIFVDHPLYKSYLIYADDAVVGYCYLTRHKNRQGYNRTAEVTIYLVHHHRNAGIGKKSLEHLECVAKGLGLKNLIGGVTGDNEASIALFEKAGFTKCAHYKNMGEKFDKILDVVAFQKEI
jgi:phosphinothricin acetyltransferase